MDSSLMDKLGGRKFLLSLVVLLIGTGVQLYAKSGVTEAFVALLLGALGVFNAANTVVSRAALKVANADSPAPEEAAEPPPAVIDAQALDSLAGRVNAIEAQVGQHQSALITLGNAVDTVNKRLLTR